MKSVISLLPWAVLAFSLESQIPITSPSKPLSLDAIPLLGFGTWNLKEKNTSEAVSWAIQTGYRHIDCAAIYGNEAEVGRGIADGLLKTGLTREDLWITSKLWNDKHDMNQVEPGIDETLQKLGVGYLDLYHMHWPVAFSMFGKKSISYTETWASMALLLQKNKTRHIGVSNFSPYQIQNLINGTGVKPSVHQMELHPYLQQQDFVDWHQQNGIHVTAYSPLGGTNPTYDEGEGPTPLLGSKTVKKIAKKRDCTPAQVILQWGMSRGTSVIPKSIHKDHITENFHAPECGLKKKDLKKLEKLGKERKRYNNPSESWGLDLYEGLEDADGKGGKAKGE